MQIKLKGLHKLLSQTASWSQLFQDQSVKSVTEQEQPILVPVISSNSMLQQKECLISAPESFDTIFLDHILLKKLIWVYFWLPYKLAVLIFKAVSDCMRRINAQKIQQK